MSHLSSPPISSCLQIRPSTSVSVDSGKDAAGLAAAGFFGEGSVSMTQWQMCPAYSSSLPRTRTASSVSLTVKRRAVVQAECRQSAGRVQAECRPTAPQLHRRLQRHLSRNMKWGCWQGTDISIFRCQLLSSNPVIPCYISQHTASDPRGRHVDSDGSDATAFIRSRPTLEWA